MSCLSSENEHLDGFLWFQLLGSLWVDYREESEISQFLFTWKVSETIKTEISLRILKHLVFARSIGAYLTVMCLLFKIMPHFWLLYRITKPSYCNIIVAHFTLWAYTYTHLFFHSFFFFILMAGFWLQKYMASVVFLCRSILPVAPPVHLNWLWLHALLCRIFHLEKSTVAEHHIVKWGQSWFSHRSRFSQIQVAAQKL